MVDENKIENAQNLLYMYIMQKSEDPNKVFTTEELENEIKAVLPMIKVMTGELNEEEYKRVIAALKGRITVKMIGIETILEDKKSEHKKWFISRRAKLEMNHWGRYYDYLRLTKKWPIASISSLDASSDKIMDLIGDPTVQKPFLRKGLIVGDIQSGKTASYTALANKAADAGYNIIIILTGMMEDLRQQTQKRLDEEFIGSRKTVAAEGSNNRFDTDVIGVGKFKGPELPPDSYTSILHDFDITKVNHDGGGIYTSKVPILMVIKKNTYVLKNLVEWLESQKKKFGHMQIKPSLLMIDDEADNASIDTSKDGENPKAINRGIRAVLNLFERRSYVGVTATPFANIFVRPDIDDDLSYKEAVQDSTDLFPSDFIYCLPTPDTYIGVNSIFSRDGNYNNILKSINVDEMESFVPAKHKKGYEVPNEMPRDLIDAMNYFVLVNAIRDVRGDEKKHRSMLIHISRLTDVQKSIKKVIEPWLMQLKRDLRSYASLSAEEAEKESSKILALHQVFDDEKLSSSLPKDITWEKLLNNYLMKAAEPITLVLQNSDSEDSLDYDAHEDGLRVIALGGDSFSRGLTLEGLCVSYFYRHSKMYDTLLQMGRWFGYRPNYDDLCRIWMDDQTQGWYENIMIATDEFKRSLREMSRMNRTPSDFGLKIRQSPDSLLVTARNKMQYTKSVTISLSVDGQYIETPWLPLDQTVMDANQMAIKEFVKTLPPVKPVNDEIYKPSLFWNDIPSKAVEKLLRSYEVPHWHLNFQGNALADYIVDNLEDAKWDVAIVEGKGIADEIQIAGKTVTYQRVKRAVYITNDSLMIGSKARIGSGGVARIGLSVNEVDKLRKDYQEDFPDKKADNMADRNYMTSNRNPLLVLYMIDPEVKAEPGNEPAPIEPFCAIGVGFPHTGSTEAVAHYIFNPVAVRNHYGDDIED